MTTYTRFTLALTALGASFAAPLIASAQSSSASGLNLDYIHPYTTGFINLVNNILVPVLMAIAFIVFVWGVYKYFIYGAASEESQTKGRQYILWSIIGFVIIFSLWGIVHLFMDTLGLNVGTVPRYPTIGNSPGSVNQGGPAVNNGGGAVIGGGNGSGAGVVQGGGVGDLCTGSGQGSCASGLFCVPGDNGERCSSSTTGGGCDLATANDCAAAGKVCDDSSGTPVCVTTSNPVIGGSPSGTVCTNNNDCASKSCVDNPDQGNMICS